MFTVPDQTLYNQLIYSLFPARWFAFLRTKRRDPEEKIDALEKFCVASRTTIGNLAPLNFVLTKPLFKVIRSRAASAVFNSHKKLVSFELDLYIAKEDDKLFDIKSTTNLTSKMTGLEARQKLQALTPILEKILFLAESSARTDKKLDSLPKPIDENVLDRLIDRLKTLEDEIILEENRALDLLNSK